MPVDQLQQIITLGQELGRVTITDHMVGVDVRNDPAFLELRGEVSKLDSPEMARDEKLWDRIKVLAMDVLRRFKDVQVASYLCYAWFRFENLTGLLAGLSCVYEILQTPPDSAQISEASSSKDKRRQRLALEWLGDRLKRSLRPAERFSGHNEVIQACLKLVDQLAAKAEEYAPGEHNASVWIAVHEMLVTMIRPAGQQVQQRSQGDQKADKRTSEPAESEVDLKQAWRLIRSAARKVQNQDPTAVWPYKILRLAEWSELQAYPTHVDFRTKISPPPADTIRRFREANSGLSWRQFLEEIESEFQNSPLWLDLQRYSYAALTGLGDQYRPAAEAVRNEVVAFVERLPDLVSFKFNDDKTPLADEDTVTWLLHPAPAESSRSPLELEAGEPTIDPISVESTLQHLWATSGVAEAAHWFQTELTKVASARERFRLRLAFANHCHIAGEQRMAMAQYKVLDREAKSHRLEEWEPTLYGEHLECWWKALTRKRGQKLSVDIAEMSDRIYTRLAKVDPVRGLKLTQKVAVD